MYNNPHLGFASTAIVKDWLSRFVWYKDIMLILKHLVKSKKLNDAHTGIVFRLYQVALVHFVYQLCWLLFT